MRAERRLERSVRASRLAIAVRRCPETPARFVGLAGVGRVRRRANGWCRSGRPGSGRDASGDSRRDGSPRGRSRARRGAGTTRPWRFQPSRRGRALRRSRRAASGRRQEWLSDRADQMQAARDGSSRHRPRSRRRAGSQTARRRRDIRSRRSAARPACTRLGRSARSAFGHRARAPAGSARPRSRRGARPGRGGG